MTLGYRRRAEVTQDLNVLRNRGFTLFVSAFLKTKSQLEHLIWTLHNVRVLAYPSLEHYFLRLIQISNSLLKQINAASSQATLHC